MSFVVADRVKEYTNSTGTGNFLLGGVEGAFMPFNSVCAIGDTFHYCIAERNGDQFEIGIGEYLAGNNIERVVVLSSTGGGLVNFGPGAKDVFITSPADVQQVLANFETAGLVGSLSGGFPEQLTPQQVKALLDITIDDIADVISPVINNRAQFNNGIYVPELTLDLVQIYNDAKT